MFRVLSDEEAENAIRWKAPDLPGNTAKRAGTREWTAPIVPAMDLPLRTPSQDDLKRQGVSNPHPSAPELEAAHRDVYSSPTTSVAVGNPSVDMLQSSYDDGYTRGYAEAEAASQQKSVDELQRIVESIGQVAVSTRDQAIHIEVVELSMAIARVLLNREISTDTDAMQRLVLAGLEQLPSLDESSCCIHLHPLDASLVRQTLGDTQGLKILEDTAMKRGDCRISSSTSRVNCGLDEWLEAMARQLGIVADEFSEYTREP